MLSDFGAEVIDAPELPGHPNSVFTRDTAVCTPQGYVELRPGIDTRAAEGRWMASILDRANEPCVGRIVPPGTVDGGDVVLFGNLAFIGLSGRTNRAGADQLSALLGPMGYEIREVPLPGHILHLDKVLMPVDPGRLIVCNAVVPESVLEGVAFLPIAYHAGSTANIICLGEGQVIVGDTNAGALAALEGAGLKVREVSVSEFVKGAGGPNCLIMPVARLKDPSARR